MKKFKYSVYVGGFLAMVTDDYWKADLEKFYYKSMGYKATIKKEEIK